MLHQNYDEYLVIALFHFEHLLFIFLFFTAYVICKKNYSSSRVVFFQSNIANSFYSKINDSSGVRTTWFWSGRSRVRVLIVPNIFKISNRDTPSLQPSYPWNFSIQGIFWNTKRFPHEVFRHYETKKFDKILIPLLSKKILIPEHF